jgi:hypothetical protein
MPFPGERPVQVNDLAQEIVTYPPIGTYPVRDLRSEPAERLRFLHRRREITVAESQR